MRSSRSRRAGARVSTATARRDGGAARTTRVYAMLMLPAVLLMAALAGAAVWAACNGVRIVANAEDDSLLYGVFAGVVVTMAGVFAAATVAGHFLVARLAGQIAATQTEGARTARMLLHGLGTPLVDLRDRIEMFSMGMCGKDEVCLFASRICDGMLSVVKTGLEIARTRAGALAGDAAEMDVAEAVRGGTERYRQAAEAKGVSVGYGEMPRSLSAVAHTDKIDSVVGNLVENAVKYTRRGGSVTVSLRSRRSGRLARAAARFGLGRPRVHAVLTVADTGIGMSRETMGRMYEEFYRADDACGMAPGHGEGLALVHAIVVSLYGGCIRCRTAEGAGTEFSVTLPLDEVRDAR